MSDGIQMSAPDLDETDEAAVLEALRSGVLGLGPMAEEFERLAADDRRGRATASRSAPEPRGCT